MSSDASYLPAASPGRRAEESSRKCDQWTVTRRRAVGTTVRQRANASTTSPSGSRDSLTNITTCPPACPGATMTIDGFTRRSQEQVSGSLTRQRL